MINEIKLSMSHAILCDNEEELNVNLVTKFLNDIVS